MTTPPVATPPASPLQRTLRAAVDLPRGLMSHPLARRVLLTLAWLAIVLAAVWTARAGLALRHWTWDNTSPIRFTSDMRNGWFWGSRGSAYGVLGYLNLYDQVVAENPHRHYVLDYVPLRLALMSAWAGHQRANGITVWINTWQANEPLMWANGISDALASLAVAGIIILAARRRGRGWTLTAAGAVVGAALLWLNPAVHVSGFGRPTWDVWILPFYLAACYATLGRQWMLAGALLGVGAMFKGQQTAVVPFFLAWCLLAGGPRALLSWITGAALGVACVVWPWVLTQPALPAETAAPTPNLVAPQAAAAPNPNLVAARAASAATPRAVAVAEAPARVVRWGWAVATVLAGAGVLVGATTLRRRLGRGRAAGGSWWPSPWSLTLAALAMASVFWAGSATGGASWAWYEVGFRYGSDKFPELEVGRSSSLAGILKTHYGFRSDSIIFDPTAWSPEITLKTLLVAVYGVGAVALGAAAGWGQWRGSTTRALIAIPAVWVLFFAVMPLMHERYLLWGAASCAVLTLRHPALMLLGIPLSLLSWAMTIFVMLQTGNRPAFELLGVNGVDWHRWISATYPGAGWGVLLIAGVMVWMALFGRDTNGARERAKSHQQDLPPEMLPPAPTSLAAQRARQVS